MNRVEIELYKKKQERNFYKMDKNKISIIVPIYNSEKTIKKCIDSVIQQTNQNWELILINDGSIDNSEQICLEYEKEDERIKFLTQENQGVSVARNKGLDIVTGDYIMFLDSDDYLEAVAIEIFNKVISENLNVDLIMCGYYNVRNEEKNKVHMNSCKLQNNIDVIKKMSTRTNFNFLRPPHEKLFKSKIIKDQNIRFDVNMDLCEDLCFVLEYLKYVNNCVIIEDCLFDIVVRQGSLSRSNRDNIMEIIEKMQNKYNELLEGKDIDKRLIGDVVFSNIMFGINMPVIFNWKSEQTNKLYSEIRNYEELNKLTIKDISEKYYKLIYILLKTKNYMALKFLVKIKNSIMKILIKK